MEKATSKVRKRTITIVERASLEIPGFRKLYQEFEEKVILRGQTKSTLSNYAVKSLISAFTTENYRKISARSRLTVTWPIWPEDQKRHP